MDDFPKSDYKEYPKSLPRTDFWGQVRRTKYGRPVEESDIRAIVSAIEGGLGLSPSDVVLDLCCGNGALTAQLYSRCRATMGVDASEYLIGVAHEYFAGENHRFTCDDVVHFVRTDPNADRMTKVLWYAGMQYLEVDDVEVILRTLHERYVHVDAVFIGAVPDRAKHTLFFDTPIDDLSILNDPVAQIGRWWGQAEICDLAGACGWLPTIRPMPGELFNAAYRYDLSLARDHGSQVAGVTDPEV